MPSTHAPSAHRLFVFGCPPLQKPFGESKDQANGADLACSAGIGQTDTPNDRTHLSHPRRTCFYRV
ncbi:hypothetical protein HDV64DRAFT_244193 [Trichoderma sp. TUCIM 5745]